MIDLLDMSYRSGSAEKDIRWSLLNRNIVTREKLDTMSKLNWEMLLQAHPLPGERARGLERLHQK